MSVPQKQFHADGSPVIRHHDDAVDCLFASTSFSFEEAVAVYLFERDLRDGIRRREDIEQRELSAQEKESFIYNRYNAKNVGAFRDAAKVIALQYHKSLSDGKWYIWTSKGAFQGFLGNVLTGVVVIVIGTLGILLADVINDQNKAIQAAVSYINKCVFFENDASATANTVAPAQGQPTSPAQ